MAALWASELRRIHVAKIGIIFQELIVLLHHALTIGRLMSEGVVLRQGLARKEAGEAAQHMLICVGIPDPANVLIQHAHEFPGSMRQRIMLASFLMLRPALVIVDEPTTAPDALIQRDVMDLVDDLGTSLVLVSHDLPLVARHTSSTIIMRRDLSLRKVRRTAS